MLKKSVLLCAIVLSACGGESKDTTSVAAKVEQPSADSLAAVEAVKSDFNPDFIVGHWLHKEIPMIGDQKISKVDNNCYQAELLTINAQPLSEPFIIERFCFDIRAGYYKGNRQRFEIVANEIVKSEWMESEGVRIMIQDDDTVIKQILDSERDFKMEFRRVKP